MAVKDGLFAKFKTLSDFAKAPVGDIEDSIRTLGLHKSKAKSLKAAAIMISDRFSGKVPRSFDDLLAIPGVGRKTANCVRGEVFGLPAIICDTHFIRLANRIGFVKTDNAFEVEKFFISNLAPERQYRYSMAANYFGRNVCKSSNPRCEDCILSDLCVFEILRKNK
ncbi:MAG TPA: endonuclease III [Spirochaetaceae bacterium]|nr:endonuclease III [Spirochaetaceae bacterium]